MNEFLFLESCVYISLKQTSNGNKDWVSDQSWGTSKMVFYYGYNVKNWVLLSILIPSLYRNIPSIAFTHDNKILDLMNCIPIKYYINVSYIWNIQIRDNLLVTLNQRIAATKHKHYQIKYGDYNG